MSSFGSDNLPPVKYAYERLPADRKAIRLLKLLPGRDSETICVELFEADLRRLQDVQKQAGRSRRTRNRGAFVHVFTQLLAKLTGRIDSQAYPVADEIISFEALSYTWGDENVKEQVLCDGLPLLITTNCKTALSNLRRENSIRILWIDAICIDQESASEKSHQVSMMGKIYSTALKVVVWLGEEDADTPLLVRCIKAASDLNGMDPGGRDVVYRLANSMGVESTKLIRLVSQFALRPWFERAWVLQEFALASDLDIMIGCHNLPYSGIHGFLWAVYATDRGKMACKALEYFEIRRMIQARRRPSPEWLFSRNRRRGCKDPRDKVYSQLGLCEPNLVKNVKPSYDKPLDDVYADVAFRMIECYGLNTLIEAWLPVSLTDSELPSWVPDWRRPFATSAIAMTNSDGKRMYHASKDVPMVARQLHNKELRLRGNKHDTVDLVCPEQLMIQEEDYLFGEAASLIRAWWAFLHRHRSTYFTLAVQDLRSVLVRVMHCDMAVRLSKHELHTRRLNREYIVAAVEMLHDAGLITATNGLEEVAGINRDKCHKISRFVNPCLGRKLFITKKGFVGLGPPALRPDDLVCILYGADVPFALRRQGDKCVLVESCYVDGLMDGEGVNEDEAMDFVLI